MSEMIDLDYISFLYKVMYEMLMLSIRRYGILIMKSDDPNLGCATISDLTFTPNWFINVKDHISWSQSLFDFLVCISFLVVWFYYDFSLLETHLSVTLAVGNASLVCFFIPRQYINVNQELGSHW